MPFKLGWLDFGSASARPKPLVGIELQPERNTAAPKMLPSKVVEVRVCIFIARGLKSELLHRPSTELDVTFFVNSVGNNALQIPPAQVGTQEGLSAHTAIESSVMM